MMVEVSMTEHFVANALNRIIDRATQVHGALGYSTNTPLANMFQHARWARFADGADEIHLMRSAERAIAANKDHGTTASATGSLPISPHVPPACSPNLPGVWHLTTRKPSSDTKRSRGDAQ